MLELQVFIEPVVCPSLSPVAVNEKGKGKGLKIV
jgi:hypothetical protein